MGEDDQQINYNYNDIKTLLTDFVDEVSRLVKHLYPDEIAKIDKILEDDEDYSIELTVKMTIFEVLFQKPDTVLNKTVIAMLKNKYAEDQINDAESDGFIGLNNLERKIYLHMLEHSETNLQKIQKIVDPSEELSHEDELTLVRKFILEIQAINRIVNDEDIDHLIQKQYMENIIIFRVFNPETLSAYDYIGDDLKYFDRDSTEPMNAFEERAWQSISRQFIGFAQSG